MIADATSVLASVFPDRKSIGREGSLLKAAEEAYGSINALGNLRVNGSAATLDTPVTAGSTILIIPKVEGGIA